MKLSDLEFISILRLIRSENVGLRTFYDLIKFFGTASKALENIEEFAIRGGRSKPIKIYSDSEIENELKLHKKSGARNSHFFLSICVRILRFFMSKRPNLHLQSRTKLLRTLVRKIEAIHRIN